MGEGNEFISFYLKNYKKFLAVPILILLIAVFSLVGKLNATGDFINRDISLKGGVSLTVLDSTHVDIVRLQLALAPILASNEVSVRLMESAGTQTGILVESDIQELEKGKLESILNEVSKATGNEITEDGYSFETMGSALGASFFRQTMNALILAFIFMGLVVFIYFRTLVPSTAVILSAFSDIVVTIAVINMLGIKMGTAGIAALLMLIGYSIDTDIMLTTKVLKRKEIPLETALKNAFITGMTMTLTTIAAVTVALIFSQSEIIRQIMTILLIGLSIDIINTWIQNSGLLIWYVQHKEKKHESQA